MAVSDLRTIPDSYESTGFFFPVDVMAEADAGGYRARLEELEQRISGEKCTASRL